MFIKFGHKSTTLIIRAYGVAVILSLKNDHILMTFFN